MLLKILWALDVLVIALLVINFFSAGAQIRDSYLLLAFAALFLPLYLLWHLYLIKLFAVV